MPLSEIAQKTEIIEENSEKIVGKVDDLKEENHEIKSLLEELRKVVQENIGVLGVYKDIIRSNRRTNIILFILIIILFITLLHNEKEFTTYRENSMNKQEIIEILKDSTHHGE